MVWSISEICWPRPEAKPVRADDAQERREAELPRFQDDDPPAPLPVDQVDDLSLLRARRKLDYRPVARADRVETPSRQTGSRNASSAASLSTPAGCGSACFLAALAILAVAVPRRLPRVPPPTKSLRTWRGRVRRTRSIAFAASSPCACSPLDSPRTFRIKPVGAAERHVARVGSV